MTMRAILAKVLTTVALAAGTTALLPAVPAGAAVVHVDCSTTGSIRIVRADWSRICIGGSGTTGRITKVAKIYTGFKTGVITNEGQGSRPFGPGETFECAGGDCAVTITYW
ncbi:hypothetical protein [Streptomyces zaomyceticus]|uniref:hypothetical protein n=1 Tax=Streptomyces zaomyceticus TaxID=68286 RepID=UPI0036CB3820